MEHRNYLNAENHVITKGMRSREDWREQMEQINKEFSNLTTTTTSNKIPHKNVDMSTLESKVNTLQELLTEVIKSIEEADREHHQQHRDQFSQVYEHPQVRPIVSLQT